LVKGLNDLAIGPLGPTAPQATCLPLVRDAKNVLCCSETGSGKTLVYLLPFLNEIVAKRDAEQWMRKVKQRRGITRVYDGPDSQPKAVILVPNRELALQVDSMATAFARHAPFSHGVACNGEKMSAQRRQLKGAIDLLIATPSRLLEMVEQESIKLSSVRMLAIDEADAMLVPGSDLEAEVRRILCAAKIVKRVKERDPEDRYHGDGGDGGKGGRGGWGGGGSGLGELRDDGRGGRGGKGGKGGGRGGKGGAAPEPVDKMEGADPSEFHMIPPVAHGKGLRNKRPRQVVITSATGGRGLNSIFAPLLYDLQRPSLGAGDERAEAATAAVGAGCTGAAAASVLPGGLTERFWWVNPGVGGHTGKGGKTAMHTDKMQALLDAIRAFPHEEGQREVGAAAAAARALAGGGGDARGGGAGGGGAALPHEPLRAPVPTMVFCNTVKSAEFVSRALREYAEGGDEEEEEAAEAEAAAEAAEVAEAAAGGAEDEDSRGYPRASSSSSSSSVGAYTRSGGSAQPPRRGSNAFGLQGGSVRERERSSTVVCVHGAMRPDERSKRLARFAPAAALLPWREGGSGRKARRRPALLSEGAMGARQDRLLLLAAPEVQDGSADGGGPGRPADAFTEGAADAAEAAHAAAAAESEPDYFFANAFSADDGGGSPGGASGGANGAAPAPAVARKPAVHVDDALCGEANILVCTDALARGVDLPHVRHVIMFDFPESVADYIHRAGRTARAGGDGLVTSLVSRRDNDTYRLVKQKPGDGDGLSPLERAAGRKVPVSASAQLAM
jgi:superfamily II DNA/RNA helicase